MALGNYRSVEDCSYGKIGPCLLKSHPQEHKLEATCLNAMSGFFYNQGNFGKTFQQFLDAVRKK
jgi:hypothetical protein